MHLQLQDKTSLVGGSTAGIGLAIAETLAVEGARVIVNGRGACRVKRAIGSIHAAVAVARLEALTPDLPKADAVAEAARRLPGVDIFVNGLDVYVPKPFGQITDADWTAIIETHFLNGVRLSRHYLPRMESAGWRRIIVISSESAVNTPVKMVHYAVISDFCT